MAMDETLQSINELATANRSERDIVRHSTSLPEHVDLPRLTAVMLLNASNEALYDVSLKVVPPPELVWTKRAATERASFPRSLRWRLLDEIEHLRSLAESEAPSEPPEPDPQPVDPSFFSWLHSVGSHENDDLSRWYSTLNGRDEDE